MKRHEKMTAPRLLEAVYKRPGNAARFGRATRRILAAACIPLPARITARTRRAARTLRI